MLEYYFGGLKVKILILLAISALKDCTRHAKVTVQYLACSRRSYRGDGAEQKTKRTRRWGMGESEGTLVRLFNKSSFRYTRFWYTL